MTNQQFRTPINQEKSAIEINHNQSILTFGSCFSNHIGEKFQGSGFNAIINPFGTLYNPISIANAITKVVKNEHYTADNLMLYNELWLSFDHHGKYSNSSKNDILETINQEIDFANSKIQENSLLIITLGSAHIYRCKQTGEIVGNCHKISSKSFSKEVLSVEEIVEKFSACLNEVFSKYIATNILFTISPVRYLSDGFFENQLSKATLHLAVAQLKKRFNQVHYFPAYEIMMDDLRDYRYYAEDMIHPSPLAIEYIWEQLNQSYFTKPTQQIVQQIQELHKALAHKPFRAETSTYQNFIKSQIQKIATLQNQNPTLNLGDLKQQFLQKATL